jgi:hypothetical protein
MGQQEPAHGTDLILYFGLVSHGRAINTELHPWHVEKMLL